MFRGGVSQTKSMCIRVHSEVNMTPTESALLKSHKSTPSCRHSSFGGLTNCLAQGQNSRSFALSARGFELATFRLQAQRFNRPYRNRISLALLPSFYSETTALHNKTLGLQQCLIYITNGGLIHIYSNHHDDPKSYMAGLCNHCNILIEESHITTLSGYVIVKLPLAKLILFTWVL